MAQIGTFTRAEDGSYTGTIKTLSLNIKARFLPAEPSENEKAPNLRVVAGLASGRRDAFARGSCLNSIKGMRSCSDPI